MSPNNLLVSGKNDIDLLHSLILHGMRQFWLPVAMFDLNNDGNITRLDSTVWVKDIKHTYLGDADLDGEFDSGDLVSVLAAGQYEDTIDDNSSWGTGDWNGDSEFNSSDLVVALANGGYESGPRAGVDAVPEPTGQSLVVVAVAATLRIRRTVR